LNEQENFKKARYSSNTDDNKDLTNSVKADEEVKNEELKDKVVSKEKETESKAKIAVVK
jgi:predicted component of type VI protein secretion system